MYKERKKIKFCLGDKELYENLRWKKYDYIIL